MLFNTIFLLGAIHGLFLSVLLASKKVNRVSNRILGALMLVFTIDLAMAAFLGYGLADEYPHFLGIDYAITLLYGPLLFLYTETLIRGAERLSKKEWLHFIPFALLFIYLIPFYLMSGPDKLALLTDYGDLQYARDWIPVFKLIFNLIYIPFALRLIYKFRIRLKENYSTIEKLNLNWLQGFILGGVIVAVVATILFTMAASEGQDVVYTELTLLAVTVYIYSIGYMGLRQPEFFANTVMEHEEVVPEVFTAETKYTKSGLDEETGKVLMNKVKSLMESQKPYINNELSLRDLAAMAGISTHNLTEIINRYADKNFYDFINTYRVEEVKARMSDPAFNNMTLLAIGLDSGFNSKSSFNSVFKKQTGMTPSEYKRSIAAS